MSTSSRKLFVLNYSVYWYWYLRNGPSGKPYSIDPLDEHHTYFFHMLMEKGLVDEVVIYTNRKALNTKEGIPETIKFSSGKMRLSYDLSYKEVHDSQGHIIYCRDRVNDAKLFPQHLAIAKVVGEGFPKNEHMRWLPRYIPKLCKKRSLNSKTFSIQLTEGPYNSRYVAPGVMPVVWPSFSAQSQYYKKMKRDNDWIIISSISPRKRVLETLRGIAEHKKIRRSKGVLILSKSKQFNPLLKELDILISRLKLNIDIHLDLGVKDKVKLICQSKILLSLASQDSGPRTVIEAAQLKTPILGLYHHGSVSAIVKNGINGEVIRHFSQFPEKLAYMLDNHEVYTDAIRTNELSQQTFSNNVVTAIEQELQNRFNNKSIQ